ncbi:MAG: UvrD-helicase domain-containing protein, partial [Clostridia bacterium]|nr:UvrD-helicase domain-containing protein [Clostridia bacterium]
AAAAEMREKMAAALRQAVAAAPRNRHLRRQLALLPTAAFETIDGFFLRLIRRHAAELSISPAVRIAGEGELQLLEESVTADLLEQCYREGEADFLSAVEYFSDTKDDSRFLATVALLRKKIAALPDREGFLRRQIEFYTKTPDFAATPFGRELLRAAAMQLDYVARLLGQAMELAESDDVLCEKHLPALEQDLLYLQKLDEAVSAGDFDRVTTLLADPGWARLGPAGRADEGTKERVMALRDQVKKGIKNLREKSFFLPTAEAASDAAALLPALRGLAAFVLELEQRLRREKDQRRLLDHNDVTHLCFSLLLQKDEAGRFVPTPRARELSTRWSEILIDEYQDTNELQDLIFRALSREEKNLFMVGDAKQSIYLFRQAEPRIFVEKRRSFAPLTEEGAGQRQVILSRNFRSRAAILAFVNAVFERTMGEELGGLSYQEEALHFGASIYDPKDDPPVELHLLTEASASEASEEEDEAGENEYVADLVTKLLATATVTDKDGTVRPAEKRDIVILLRSVTGRAPLIEQALSERGIEAACDAAETFFLQPEVLLLLSLLEVVDNPLSDVPFAAVLRSPLCGLTPDQLAEIRLAGDGPFYYAARAVRERLPAVDDFLTRLEQWRELAERESVERLMLVVMEQSGLMTVTAAASRGEQRCRNLRLLLRQAAEFEQNGSRGLFRFLRYLNGLRQSGRPAPFADKAAVSGEVVRIMSIHKSKGLEFPIVIVAGLGRRINTKDLGERFLMQTEVGIGLKLRDNRRMAEFDTLQRAGVCRRLEREMRAEELRCLYVALTRARERLLLVADTRGSYAPLRKLAPAVRQGNGRVHPAQLLAATSLGELLLLPLQGTSVGRDLCRFYGIDPPDGPLPPLPCRLIPAEVVRAPLPTAEREEAALPAAVPADFASALTPLPHAGAVRLPTKLTVTRLKDLMQTEDPDLPAGRRLAAYRPQKQGLGRPAFFRETAEATPAEAGTAMHELVQFAYLRRLADDPEGEIDELVQQGFLSPRQRELLSISRVRAFTDSPLFAEMLAADTVRRELRFTQLVPAGLLLPDLDAETARERVLLQGVIDCVYERDGEVVLVDYKTDRVRAVSVLAERYRSQLLLYCAAYRRMTGRAVHRAVIYSFHLAETVELKVEEAEQFLF